MPSKDGKALLETDGLLGGAGAGGQAFYWDSGRWFFESGAHFTGPDPWSDIRAFRKPSDGTDDTPAFNGATTNAAEVFLPARTTPYIFSSTTLTRGNVRYRGVPGQTTIKLVGQGGGANVALCTLAASGITFEDIIFDGNGATIGSGIISGPGLFMVNGGSNDITFRRCTFQNTGGSGIYAFGYQGTQIYRLRIEDCQFSNIGRAGSGNGGCCIFLDGGVNDAKILRNRCSGTLTSDFIKIKSNTGVNCNGTLIENNTVDYSACTTFDAANSALGIELFNGAYYSRVIGNYIIGPDTAPVAGNCWGISCGDARYSTISANVIQGGASNQAMAYGIETAECPFLTVTGNSIIGVSTGMNSTNNNPLPSHAQTIKGNIFYNCYIYGFTSDSGPAGIKLEGNIFVDCGTRYIFLNSTNAISKQVTIAGNTFLIKDQTRTEGGVIYGVYIVGTGATDVIPADISGNYFGPFPAGASTIGILAIEVNTFQGARIINNRFDGSRPSDNTAQAPRAINGDNYGLTVKGNYARNFATEFGYSTTDQVSVWEDNDIGSLTIQHPPTAAAGANAGGSPPAPVLATVTSPRGGSLTFGTGTTPAAGAQVVVTFHMQMLSVPIVTLTAGNTATQALGLYVSSVSASGFTISCTTAPAASQANTIYSVSWHAFVP